MSLQDEKVVAARSSWSGCVLLFATEQGMARTRAWKQQREQERNVQPPVVQHDFGLRNYDV